MVLVKNVSSKAEFNRYASKEVIVMFSGDSCPACVQAKPLFSKMAMTNKRPFLIVDRTKLTDLTDSEIGLKIASIPTFVKYKNGKKVSNVVGFDKAQLERMAK